MDQPLLVPGQRLGPLRVERLVGRGGISEVYLVTELALDLPLALKVLVSEDPEWARRMLREGRAQHLVRHPNVVQVHTSLTVGGRPALLLDFVPGTDLRRWLQVRLEVGSWPPLAEALALFSGILAGVEAAHARGLVHRDLKPANVLLDLSGPTPVPRLTDFGLVRDLVAVDDEATQTGAVVGTRGYIAPEQIWALPDVDARADVHALGCLLFLLCCGREAFADEDEALAFRRVLAEDYPDPGALAPGLPSHVAEAIRHCLVADRAQRMPSCAALRAALAEAEPPPPAPPVAIRPALSLGPLLMAAAAGAALGAGSVLLALPPAAPPARVPTLPVPLPILAVAPPAVAPPAAVPAPTAVTPAAPTPTAVPPVMPTPTARIDALEPAPPEAPAGVVRAAPASLWEAAAPEPEAAPWGERPLEPTAATTATAAVWATAPPPEPPRLGRVLVQGSPLEFCLRAAAGGDPVCDTRVPAGTWEVLLRLPDGSLATAGRVEVVAGQVTTMACDEQAWTCR